ncbi:hypothetical protein [Celeribacter baekdonensis]|uniref:hypothetical protein n=1 Tax=Celeribacter baekdonensis TaxID=875171 RepID=UPI003A8E7E03
MADKMLAKMYMLLLEATAGPKIAKRPGLRNALIGFVVAPAHGVALERAVFNLRAQGWDKVFVKNCKAISANPDRLTDPDHKAAAQKALKNGAAFIVFAGKAKRRKLNA